MNDRHSQDGTNNAAVLPHTSGESPEQGFRYGNHFYTKEPVPGFPNALKRDDGAVYPYGLESSED